MGGCLIHAWDFFNFIFSLSPQKANELFASIQVIDLCKLQPLVVNSIPFVIEFWKWVERVVCYISMRS